MSTRGRLIIKVDGLTRWIETDTQKVRNSFDDIGESIKEEGIKIMREEVPHGTTSRLEDSVKGEVTTRKNGGTIKITATAPYAEILDGDGRTESHDIYPRRKALRFVTSGENAEYKFAKHVRHPGSKQTPFTRRTIERLREVASEKVKEALRSV